MRAVRKQAESGFYHVVARGNGKQILFEDDTYRERFVGLLGECAERFDVGVIAWCLMENHVHLVLDDVGNRLSEMMCALLSRYARFFSMSGAAIGNTWASLSLPRPT